jgi:hypothetical protein
MSLEPRTHVPVATTGQGETTHRGYELMKKKCLLYLLLAAIFVGVLGLETASASPQSVNASSATAISTTVPQIIWDTDIGGDCDDSADLALLCALADAGECHILACTGCYDRYTSGYTQAAPQNIEIGMNYYGHFYEPVGHLQSSDLPPEIVPLTELE